MTRWRDRLLSRSGTDARGVAAIEFALATPLLVALAMAIAELGYSAYQAMQVQYAVEAAVFYAASKGGDVAGIAAAASNATSLTGLNISTPPQFCGCPNNNGITATSCSSTCNGAPPSQYVQINASVTRQSLLPDPLLPLPAAFTVHVTVRLN